MRVPQDQGLFLAIFLTCCLAATVVLWVFLPVHHVVESEEDGDEQTEPFALPEAVSPEGRVIRMEKALAMASTVITKLEGSEKDKEKEKTENKAGGKAVEKAAAPASEKAPVKGNEKGQK
jgi:hypothetical protein